MSFLTDGIGHESGSLLHQGAVRFRSRPALSFGAPSWVVQVRATLLAEAAVHEHGHKRKASTSEIQEACLFLALPPIDHQENQLASKSASVKELPEM